MIMRKKRPFKNISADLTWRNRKVCNIFILNYFYHHQYNISLAFHHVFPSVTTAIVSPPPSSYVSTHLLICHPP
uniref:Uncharacterized protein n=1 Tax=Helianthus annuus TaxID=4232 RepID=A0A251TFW9_HELAN